MGYFGYVHDVTFTSLQLASYFPNHLPGFIEKYHIVFNIYGNIETHQTYSSINEIGIIREYSYNERQQPTRIRTLSTNTEENKTVTLQYNDQHHLMERKEQKANTFIIHQYAYDASSDPFRHTQIEPGDTTEVSLSYSYDEDGRLLKREQVGITDKGISDATYEFVYDEAGNLVKELRTSALLGSFDFTYTYNKKNQLVSIVQSNEITGTTETRYDQFKNPVFIRSQAPGQDEKIITYTYTYDRFSNWTNRKTFLTMISENGRREKKHYSNETQEIIYYKFVRKKSK
jgi:hypothetical protein